MRGEIRPHEAIVPIVRASVDGSVLELLGSGFFVGDEEHLCVVTAKHVIEGNPLETDQGYGVVFAGRGSFTFAWILSMKASRKFDVAACEVAAATLPHAIRLPIARNEPALSMDVLCFEYSSTRIETRPDGGTHAAFEPHAHKGNVVMSYQSTYPESVPTPSYLTSFPALQGASGAPVLVSSVRSETFAVVGIMVANAERHLLPAQILTIQEEGEVREETRYFLPYGKALGRAALSAELEAMGVRFQYADI